FQKNPLLRVQYFRFARIESEKRRVEQVGALQDGSAFYEIGNLEILFRHARGDKFSVGEIDQRFDAILQVSPEGLQVFRVGKPPRHADDGNGRIQFSLFRTHRSSLGLKLRHQCSLSIGRFRILRIQQSGNGRYGWPLKELDQ